MILHTLLSYEFLRVIWWLLLGVLLVGFAVTDGFDLGTGMLLPFAGRNDLERRVVINSVGPVWEGNQVWLILGGGAIFAAWPQLYAVSFSGFYLAMFAILVALILRPVAFKFRGKRDDAALARALGLGAVHRRLRAVADLRRGDGQRAAGRAVPLRRRHAHLLRRHLLRPAQSVRVAVRAGVGRDAGDARRRLAAVEDRGRRWPSARAPTAAWRRWRPSCSMRWPACCCWPFVDGYRVTSALPADGPSNPLLKTVEVHAGAWFTNYAAHPLAVCRAGAGPRRCVARVAGAAHAGAR